MSMFHEWLFSHILRRDLSERFKGPTSLIVKRDTGVQSQTESLIEADVDENTD